MTRVSNLMLIIITLAGVSMLIWNHFHDAQVRIEYERLAPIYGGLDVKDRANYVVSSVRDDDPHAFRWQIYCPPLTIKETIIVGNGSIGGGSRAEAKVYNCFLRIQLKDGYLMGYARGISSSSQFVVADGDVGKFILEHWDDVEVEFLGAENPFEVASDELVKLITIRIPEDLQTKMQEQLGDQKAKQYVKHGVLQWVYGTDQAFANPPASEVQQ